MFEEFIIIGDKKYYYKDVQRLLDSRMVSFPIDEEVEESS